MKIQVKVIQTNNSWKAGNGIYTACWLAGCLLAGYLLVGCKSSIATTTSGAVITKTDETFFASVLERSFSFKTFSARVNLDFSGAQQEFSSRVQVKMIHNDRIQLSIQPFLGVEMFRVELSNDSIKILDRMNKRYVSDNYHLLKNEFDIDINFQNLQALLTNRMFIPGENSITAQQYRQFRITKQSSRQAELQSKGKSGTFYTFLADSDEKLLSTKIENNPRKQKLTWEYANFQTINNQLFPTKMIARLTSDDQVQGTTTLTFSQPEINGPVSIAFTVPSEYNRVRLEQLIQSLMGANGRTGERTNARKGERTNGRQLCFL